MCLTKDTAKWRFQLWLTWKNDCWFLWQNRITAKMRLYLHVQSPKLLYFIVNQH